MNKSSTTYQEAEKLLRLPFTPDEIDFHVVTDRVLLHIDARAVRKRLNKASGHNWQTRMTPCAGGMICELEVLGITRTDAGEESNFSPVKGAASSALKRAAINHGIGEYLYECAGKVVVGRGNYSNQYAIWLAKEGIDLFGWPLAWSPDGLGAPEEFLQLRELYHMQKIVKAKATVAIELGATTTDDIVSNNEKYFGTKRLDQTKVEHLDKLNKMAFKLDQLIEEADKAQLTSV